MKNNIFILIARETRRLERSAAHSLDSIFMQISRYESFLSVILKRYRVANDGYIDMLNKKFRIRSPKRFPKTSEGLVSSNTETKNLGMLQHEENLRTNLHLEIESYYLFSKILLDKIAQFVEFYFGKARGLSLISHDKLTKKIGEYTKAKNLTPLPDKILKLAIQLQAQLSDYRDKEIVHSRDVGITKPIMTNLVSHSSRIGSFWLYPIGPDRFVESNTPIELKKLILEYFEAVVEYVLCNNDKTALRLRTESTYN